MALMPEENWSAVAEAITARMAIKRMSQTDLAAKSGMSVATIREIQRNIRPRQRRPPTLVALSEALGWPANALSEVLAGGDPPASQPPLIAQDSTLEALAGIRAELLVMRSRLDRIESKQTRD
jgi:transcriptional regulator with XRE-family HTH domain